jgi:hypothetical protein
MAQHCIKTLHVGVSFILAVTWMNLYIYLWEYLQTDFLNLSNFELNSFVHQQKSYVGVSHNLFMKMLY